MRSLSECTDYGQTGGKSVVRREFAWRGTRADSRICDWAARDSAIAGTSCNKQNIRTEMQEFDAPGVVR